MDKKQMMNVLVPALAAAAVVVLVALLIVSGDGGPTSGSGAGVSARMVAASDRNDAGMTDTLPSVDAPDWKPAPGGMKMWDVQEGDGEPCKPGATVTIHYTGWTLDGNTFDTSRKSGSQPVTFDLASLIKGWQEGIPGMKPGGIRRLKIPPEWAYGAGGSPPKIPPNATLVFEVKLLGWK